MYNVKKCCFALCFIASIFLDLYVNQCILPRALYLTSSSKGHPCPFNVENELPISTERLYTKYLLFLYCKAIRSSLSYPIVKRYNKNGNETYDHSETFYVQTRRNMTYNTLRRRRRKRNVNGDISNKQIVADQTYIPLIAFVDYKNVDNSFNNADDVRRKKLRVLLRWII